MRVTMWPLVMYFINLEWSRVCYFTVHYLTRDLLRRLVLLVYVNTVSLQYSYLKWRTMDTIIYELQQCFSWHTMSTLTRECVFYMQYSSMVEEQSNMLALVLLIASNSNAIISNHHRCSVANI